MLGSVGSGKWGRVGVPSLTGWEAQGGRCACGLTATPDDG